jgi:hypothetical protein
MKYIIADNAKKSGRASGNVYMKNNVIRGFTMPANPQTPPQSVQRSNFGSLSGDWNSVLTDDERIAWNNFVISGFDRLGLPVSVSGKQAYVLLNRNLFNAGASPIVDPPVGRGPTAPTDLGLTAVAPATTFQLAWTTGAIPANTSWLVFATTTFSPGTYRPGKSKFKLITVLATGTATPALLHAEYNAVFGNLVTDGSVFARVVAINTLTGFASAGLTARTIVT